MQACTCTGYSHLEQFKLRSETLAHLLEATWRRGTCQEKGCKICAQPEYGGKTPNDWQIIARVKALSALARRKDAGGRRLFRCLPDSSSQKHAKMVMASKTVVGC